MPSKTAQPTEAYVAKEGKTYAYQPSETEPATAAGLTNDQKRQLMADTMVFSDEGLRHLVAEMGVSQIVYGTDVPFNWPVTVDLVLNASFLNNKEKEAILGGNLQRLLRIGNS